MSRSNAHPRRGSTVLAVIWMIALGALIVAGVQLAGYREAMLGRHALARVQARWAARGGVEYTIAVMANHTEYPVPDDPFAIIRDMEAVCVGEYELGGNVVSSYNIRHNADGREWRGPMDLHGKININRAYEDPSLFAAFEDMPPDVIDAIRDWIDTDDEVSAQGAERDYYLSGSTPYEPRNAPMRTIGEMELVAGVWPENLRGEDWNLDNRLDPNEDDRDRTWPPDIADGVLDAGWSAFLTTYTVTGGPGPSGLPRIHLAQAEIDELIERLGVTEETAQGLIDFGGSPNSRMELLLTDYVQRTYGDNAGGVPGAGSNPQQPAGTNIPTLTREEIVAVMAETGVEDPSRPRPGRLNINTVPEELLRKLFYGREYLAEEIIFLRVSRAEGVSSLVDLADIPAFQEDTETLEYVARIMDTRSNVYAISARGRSESTGLEVEIIAVVDRSSLPVRILEYREQ